MVMEFEVHSSIRWVTVAGRRVENAIDNAVPSSSGLFSIEGRRSITEVRYCLGVRFRAKRCPLGHEILGLTLSLSCKCLIGRRESYGMWRTLVDVACPSV